MRDIDEVISGARVPQTIWREGDRIRLTDGTGYADYVSDDLIRRHIDQHAADDPDALFVRFARAVLAIREFERASGGDDV